MTLEFHLDALCVFQVVYDYLAARLGAHSYRVPVGTEANRRQRCSHLNFLDLLAFDDVVKVDAAVQTRAAKQQIVDRGERDARAFVVVRCELEPEGICLWPRRLVIIVRLVFRNNLL